MCDARSPCRFPHDRTRVIARTQGRLPPDRFQDGRLSRCDRPHGSQQQRRRGAEKSGTPPRATTRRTSAGDAGRRPRPGERLARKAPATHCLCSSRSSGRGAALRGGRRVGSSVSRSPAGLESGSRARRRLMCVVFETYARSSSCASCLFVLSWLPLVLCGLCALCVQRRVSAAPSLIVTTRPPRTSFSVSTRPLGHRTSIVPAATADPRPKCRRRSLCE
jgi:hypothetical protein